MELRVVCLLTTLSLQLMTYPQVVSLVNHEGEGIDDLENSVHRINLVDNDPEFLVGVKGLEKPLCFHMEGPANDVIRLIQDPVSDVVANARIVHQGPANKTYLGAIMVSQGPTFKILAKQRGLAVADHKYDWTMTSAMMVQGHRVVLEKDTVAVTFADSRITLVLRRHVLVKGEHDDEEEEVSASTQSDDDDDIGDNESRNDESVVTDDTDNDDEENGDEDDNNLLKGGGEVNEDLLKEGDPGFRIHARRADIVKFPPRKKRHDAMTQDITSSSENIDTAFKTSNLHFLLRRNGDPGAFETRKLKRLRDRYNENDVLRHEHSRKRKGLNKTWRKHRGAGNEHHMIPQDQSEHTYKDEDVEKKKEKIIFLGIYISDSTDFSNKTHGLLGQFLHKKVKMEKINVKNGQMKARIRIDGEEPERRFKAMLKLRTNAALNTKRACWRVRHQGRDVIDGSYPDYLVPSLRYSLMKELPPTAPI